ncbi:hypothetical protein [Streptomyces sp. NPDC046939]|uniref:hypothetical protein n=1 Tax=Streptomyces sp. NPDC046939 TaxID=3155376 RepID=UPI0033D7C309
MSRLRGVGRSRTRKPANVSKRLARSYVCGHCRSEVRGVRRDEHGIDHIDIAHDAECPVLRGAVPDEGDVYRAAARAGISAMDVRVRDGGAE